MKKTLQTWGIFLLLAALLTVHAFGLSFSDVPAGVWYADAVSKVSGLGIMIGDEQGRFNPQKPVTRAEMAVIVCRVLELTLDEDAYLPVYLVAENFSDVPESHWANGHINKASFLEITLGYGDGRFGPGDAVTYEQAVTMLVRALGGGDDAAAQGGYPQGFLRVADGLGLLSGLQGAVAGEPLSRANVAVLLSNYFRLHPPGGGAPDTTPGSGSDILPPDDKSDLAPSNTPPAGHTPDNPGQEIGDGGPEEGAPGSGGDSLDLNDSQPGPQPEPTPPSAGTGGGT